jgi:hypothetical protein
MSSYTCFVVPALLWPSDAAKCAIHRVFSRTPDLAEDSVPDLPPEIAGASQKLVRGMGLVQSTAVNMLGMIGIGPFITIGVIVSAMG